MQLQNLFYYVRYVHGIHDNILFSAAGYCVLLWWFGWFRFSMFHRIIMIPVHTHIYHFCNFIHVLHTYIVHIYVMVDSCFCHTYRNHITCVYTFYSVSGTKRCICNLHAYRHIEGSKSGCFRLDTTNEGNSTDNSIHFQAKYILKVDIMVF